MYKYIDSYTNYFNSKESVNEVFTSGVKNAVISEYFVAGFILHINNNIGKECNADEMLEYIKKKYIVKSEIDDDFRISIYKMRFNSLINLCIEKFDITDTELEAVKSLYIKKINETGFRFKENEESRKRIIGAISGINSAYAILKVLSQKKETRKIKDVFHTGRSKHLENIEIGKSDIVIQFDDDSYYGVSLKTHTTTNLAPTMTFMSNDCFNEDVIGDMEAIYKKFLDEEITPKLVDIRYKDKNISRGIHKGLMNFYDRVVWLSKALDPADMKVKKVQKIASPFISDGLKNSPGFRSGIKKLLLNNQESIIKKITELFDETFNDASVEELYLSARNMERVSDILWNDLTIRGVIPISDIYARENKKIKNIIKRNKDSFYIEMDEDSKSSVSNNAGFKMTVFTKRDIPVMDIVMRINRYNQTDSFRFIGTMTKELITQKF